MKKWLIAGGIGILVYWLWTKRTKKESAPVEVTQGTLVLPGQDSGTGDTASTPVLPPATSIPTTSPNPFSPMRPTPDTMIRRRPAATAPTRIQRYIDSRISNFPSPYITRTRVY